MKQLFSVIRQPTVPAHGGSEGYTLGSVFLDNVKFCESCEDEDRFLELGKTTKIKGVTAIPRGLYRVINSFSNRFQKVLPQLLNVEGFEGIRIHGGNKAEDSSGCILIGQVRTRNGVANCSVTVQRMIDQIDDAADLGIETWIEIK